MKKNLAKIIMAASACIALTAATTKTTQAQNGRFSVGAELGLPLGGFGDQGGIGFGGSLRYELPVGDKMGITGTAGYLTFAKKTIDYGFGKFEYSSSMIPIQAGFKYYFMEAQEGFYAMAELGVHIFSSKVTIPAYETLDIDDQGNLITVTVPESSNTESNTGLSYSVGIGYHLANLDLGLKYQIFTYTETVSAGGITVTGTAGAGYAGVRVAYVFGEK